MMKMLRTSRYGFTLVELAIVLAIVGLLFAGLWRLMSGGNQQLRDQAASSSQSQLISATKAFLASADGQGFMTNNNTVPGCGGANCNPNAVMNLPIPTSPAGGGGCAASVGGVTAQQAGTWCGYLPPGFSTASVNSYGQSYSIHVLRDATAAGTAPVTYSFMIVTSGGDQISDMSGGRISTMIGGDGGFIYNTAVCGVFNHFACGSYGSWSSDLVTYSFAYPATGGFVASRTYFAPEQDSTNQWLARFYIGSTLAYNTMKADIFMDANGNGLHGGNSNLNMAPNGITTGGGSINMAQGQINMQGVNGAINLSGGIIDLQNGKITDVSTSPALSLTTGGVKLDNPATPLATIGTACSLDSGIVVPGLTAGDPNCVAGLQIVGDGSVIGRLNVNSLYAATFIYTSSDARLKTDIHPVNKALDDIMQLQPVSFAYKANGHKSLGVIAQNVEKVYPQLVSERQDGMKTVNYEGLIAPLIGAVQELKEENDSLRKQVKDQATQQEKLERELHQTH